MLKRRVVALLMIFSLLSLPIAAQNGGGDMLTAHPHRSDGTIPDHEDHAHVYGRLWTTADGFAKPQSRRGMGR